MKVKTKTLTLILTSLMLISCSDDNNQTNSTQGLNSKAPAIAVKESKLVGYLNKENPCDLILPADKLKQAFNIQTEIRVSGSEYQGSAYCDYNWDRADKAERNEKYQYYLSDRMSKKVKEVSMRLTSTASSFRIVVSGTTAQADKFVPPPKSEADIRKLVDAAKQSTFNALTDEQKKLADDSANEVVETMIRESNQTTQIDNLVQQIISPVLVNIQLYIYSCGLCGAKYWTGLINFSTRSLSQNIKPTAKNLDLVIFSTNSR